MTIPSVHCEVKKHSYRQTQDGIVVSFVLHPSEVPEIVTLAPLGTRFMLAIAQIGDDEKPVAQAERERRKWESMPLPQRAALLCQDAAFHEYAEKCAGNNEAAMWALADVGKRIDLATDYMRWVCGVTTRRDIQPDTAAGDKYIKLETDFRIAAGRMPEPR